MQRSFILGAAVFVASLSAPAFPASPAKTSVYTAVDLDDCAFTEVQEESGAGTWRCPGLGGHPLIIAGDDSRYDVDVGVDNDLWESPPGFNRPPDRIEWRLHRKSPVAIIYRFRLEAGGSVLAVETIGRVGKPGCLVAWIPGTVPHANAVAREEADRDHRGFRCGRDQPVSLGVP